MTEIKVLDKNAVLGIFKKHSRLQKDMNYDQFVTALDAVAEAVFEDDEPSDVKQKNLYRYLRQNNPNPPKPKQPIARRSDNSQR